jgi:chloramphenicol-sensitive protein RarD
LRNSAAPAKANIVTRHQLPDRTGLAMGFGAYALWGLLPIYIHALRAVPPLQFLAHRVLWSAVLVVAIVALLRRVGALAAAARGRTLAMLALSATLIAANWAVYIWSVETGHVLEASLGYFINPLVNVVLGVAVLGERLRRPQLVAILVAAAGVLTLAVAGGGALWISLALAVSFGLYGLVRKVAAIDALGGLTVETLVLAPLAALLLIHASLRGESAFGHVSIATDWMLAFSGVVTAMPLLLFAAAARRLPLVTLGLLQYVAPTIQFLLAVLLFHESVAPIDWIAFPLIWLGCLIYGYDGIRAARAALVCPPE